MIDERGQSVVIGSLFVFAFLIIGFSLYQAFVIPQQNEKIELQHSQVVSGDMATMRTALVSLSETGGVRTESIRLGTSYPSRIIGVNPGPPSGTIATEQPGEIHFGEGFNATEVCGYEPTSRALTYRPNYNLLQTAPTVRYENSIVYREFDEGYIVDTNQTLINDETIFLAPLNRTYSRGGSDRISITFKAGPQGGATNETDTQLKLTIPSQLPPDVWETNDKLFGKVDAVKSVVSARGGDAVEITLKSGLYTVKCRAIGVEQYPVSGQSVPLSLAGPVVENISLSSSSVPQGQNLDIEAIITDENKGGIEIESAEWRDLENDNHGGKMVSTDGKFDQVNETVRNSSIDTSGWSTGDHTLQVRGIDAQGNVGEWTNVTLTVNGPSAGSGGSQIIQGIAYQNNNGRLYIYQYGSDEIYDTGFQVKAEIGGILDWDGDGNITEIPYEGNSNKFRVYDKSDDTRTKYDFKVSNVVGFEGDFDGDGDAREVLYLTGNEKLEMVRNGSSDPERIPVNASATGEQITSVTKQKQITGTSDVDGDGEGEFAYIDGNNNLVIADIASADANEISIRRQFVSETFNNDVKALGEIGDLDDDGFEDDIPIKTKTQAIQKEWIRYYDVSRGALFLYKDVKPKRLGPTLDADSDGKQELYFVNQSQYLTYFEVGSSTVQAATYGGGNEIKVGNSKIGGGR